MRLRLLLLSVLAVIGIATASLVATLGGAPALLPGPLPPADSAWDFASAEESVWAREHRYLSGEKWALFNGDTTEAAFNPSADMPVSSTAVRVLVLGDSFMYGIGEQDPDTRWWVKLQDALDAHTAPGAFAVRAIGIPGAGTSMHNEWLRSDLVADFAPDVVVVGYVFNDPVPHNSEFAGEGVCAKSCPPLLDRIPEYKECLAASTPDSCKETVTAQRPDAVLESEATARPLDNPFSGVFRQAVADLADAAKDTPLVWMPTPTIPAEWELAQEVQPLFRGAGFITVEPAQTVGRLRPLPPGVQGEPDLHVHPNDRHPGPALTFAYAYDAAKAILEAVPPERVTAATNSALVNPPQTEELVSWVLPIAADGGSDAQTAIVRSAGDHTEESTGQVAPCAAMNRPHARVVLSRLLPPGSEVDVTLRSGQVAGVDVYAFGYMADGASTLRRLGTLSMETPLTVVTGPQARGILLAPPGTPGCAADRAIALPEFVVTLERN